jgi:ABC-type dipeptide/oligopeptide/nickel transport system permease subunit
MIELGKILRRMFRRNKLALASLFVIVALIATALLAPWIAPYDPNQPDMGDTLSLPSTRHLLGTDQLGRDILSRIIWGARISLQVGIIAVGIAFVLGTILGMFGA